MSYLNFRPCFDVLDVCTRPDAKLDSSQCYEYKLFHADNYLAVSEKAESILRKQIDKHFELKEDPIGLPKMHLGGSNRKLVRDNVVEAQALSPSKNEKSSISNAESYLKEKDLKLPKKAETPVHTTNMSEVDASPNLGLKKNSYFQSLIGVMYQMLELGLVHI